MQEINKLISALMEKYPGEPLLLELFKLSEMVSDMAKELARERVQALFDNQMVTIRGMQNTIDDLKAQLQNESMVEQNLTLSCDNPES